MPKGFDEKNEGQMSTAFSGKTSDTRPPARAVIPCAEARPLLSAALDQEVGEPSQAQLALHLAACSACARYRAEIVTLDNLTRQAFPQEPLRAGLWENVAGFLTAASAESGDRGPAPVRPHTGARRYGALGHPVARAAAAVLIVIGAYIALRTVAPDLDPVGAPTPRTSEMRETTTPPAPPLSDHTNDLSAEPQRAAAPNATPSGDLSPTKPDRNNTATPTATGATGATGAKAPKERTEKKPDATPAEEEEHSPTPSVDKRAETS